MLIRGARVVDGSGNPWFWGDVALRGDRIATLSRSPLQPTQADQVLNAEGRCVCPGFIDVQSHSIIAHMLDGRALSKVHQGVTTEIMGERWTPAPFGGEIAEVWKEVGVPLRIKPTEWEARMRGWNRFCDWPVAIEASGVSVNIGGYLAGGTLREYVRGMDMGESNPAQLEALRQVSHQAMQDGAFGVSYALIYPPESYVSTEEIIEVCKVVAHHGGVYATHMRSEGDEIEAALDEAIHIGKASGAAVHIFHLKAAGQANWSKLPAVLKRIHQARCQGVDVSANMYAYTAGMTRLSALLPSWAASGEGLAANLANPEVKARLHQEMLKRVSPASLLPSRSNCLM